MSARVFRANVFASTESTYFSRPDACSDFNDSLTGTTGANVLTGGNGNDTMDGGAGGDKLLGGNGNDQIIGNDGNDSLTGGAGADTQTGGLGADRFIFTATADSPVGAGADHIVDFNHTQGDKIDLSAIDAIVAGDQSFAFIGNQVFHGVAGELRYVSSGSSVTVGGDVNGDGVADFATDLDGVASVASSDFIL
jgi:Ca2+-binding RTX toxin-like protein